ncbi:MAG: hypothetical protein CL867_08640 [Cytophagaceae bacterium]|nr:hypothetical protein [Cytophagaceae bacterium]
MWFDLILIIVFQLFFLGVYDYLFKKETFFTVNRWYLLLAPLVSICIVLLPWPFLDLGITSGEKAHLPLFISELTTIKLGDITASTSASTSLSQAYSLSIMLGGIWMLGLLVSLAFFLKKLHTIKQYKKNAKIGKINGFKVVFIPNSNLAFSFYKTVYLGSALSKTQQECIIKHEAIHITQRHTLDLIFFEVLRILFWFNPLIYMFQHRMQTLQEYIVDAQMTQTSYDKNKYVEQLLSQIFQTSGLSFANSFFTHSLIKNRIIMLQKSKSSRYQQLKYLTVIPVLSLMIFCAASMQSLLAQTPTNTEVKAQIVQKQEVETLPYAVIDVTPAFKGCEDILNPKERAACTSDKVSSFVNKNFDIKAAEAVSQAGINRIFVKFKIDKSGNVVDVVSRASNKALSDIANKAVSALPQMIPGQHQGKKVNVLYSLPISFKINK